MANFLHPKSGSFIPRRKKTREQVQQDLLKTLRKDARKQMEQNGIDLGDGVELSEALRRLAAWHFQRSYQYRYDDNSTACRPSGLVPKGAIASLAGSHSMTPGDGTLQSYINMVMSQVNFLGTLKERAVKNLADAAERALNDRLTSGNNWHTQAYSRTFEFLPEEDPDGKRNAIRADGVFVYSNAHLNEDDQDVSLCTLYYMAVYYEVTSEQAKKLDDFQKYAIATAKIFANSRFPLRSESEIGRALQSYGPTPFRMKFQFEYADDSPPDLAENLNASDVKRHFLFSSSNKNREEWFFGVAKQYLDALELPDKYNTIKGQAVDNLTETLVDFSKQAADAQWESKPFDRVYQLPGAELTQTRFSGYIFHYRQVGKVGDRDVSLVYVSILGVLYEGTVASK